jgi:adenine-specific DNA-methyltransferase
MVEKINLESENSLEENISKLKKIFPQIFLEGKVDFDKLKETLGDFVNSDNPKYSFSWAGKDDSIRNIQTPTNGTLIPQKDESINFDETENIFIEGDNLEILKLLQKSYTEKVKMIYIDPPYNTGNDFVYKDNFKNSLNNYLEQTKQFKDGNRLTTNTETSGRFHSDWISFIFSRLFLSRQLLREDGIIYVSIDDSELHNLIFILNDIFGEENQIANIVWKRKRGRDNSAKYLSKSHEYLLVYAKNKSKLKTHKLELDESTLKQYKNPDNDHRGKWRGLGLWSRGIQGGSEYEFISKSGKKFEKRLWLVNKSSMEKLEKEKKLVIIGDKVYRKLFLNENKGKVPETLWDDTSNAANAADEIKKIFGVQIFDTPKPIPYIKRMIEIATEDNDLILDFFAGSGSTAHAVLEHNFSQDLNLKFISVQLPEPVNQKSLAFEHGFKNIAEISKKRIRYAIEETQEKYSSKNKSDVNLGFKVFKLVKSNYKIWEDVQNEEKLKDQLKLFEDPLIEKYKDIDVIYEIIIKEGYSLNSQIKEVSKKPNKIYKVLDGEFFFYVTLDKKIDEKSLDDLNLDKNIMFVCLDLAINDSQKTNLDKLCKLKTI